LQELNSEWPYTNGGGRYKSKVGEGILQGLEQALAFANGTAGKSQYVLHIPPKIYIRAIRGRLGLMQQEFAPRFGFSVNTVRHWEQGRSDPDGPTRADLTVTDREPETVRKALRIARGAVPLRGFVRQPSYSGITGERRIPSVR
jgi:putative transcriptional regulator